MSAIKEYAMTQMQKKRAVKVIIIKTILSATSFPVTNLTPKLAEFESVKPSNKGVFVHSILELVSTIFVMTGNDKTIMVVQEEDKPASNEELVQNNKFNNSVVELPLRKDVEEDRVIVF